MDTLCEIGLSHARVVLANLPPGGSLPMDPDSPQSKAGSAAMYALEDHGTECTQCAPVMAGVFVDGLRGVVARSD